MTISSYVMEYGVVIEFTHTVTYPTKKDKDGRVYELRHLPMIGESWSYSIGDNIFTSMEKALEYAKTLDMYKKRKAYDEAQRNH